MHQITPLQLHKPHGRPHNQIVELYEDETTTTAAEPDTSVVKMLNDVMPKTPFPDTYFVATDLGGAFRGVVAGMIHAGQAIGNAIDSVGQSLNGGSSSSSGIRSGGGSTGYTNNPPSS